MVRGRQSPGTARLRRDGGRQSPGTARLRRDGGRQSPGMWKTVSRDGSAEMSPGMAGLRRNISAEEETVTRDSLAEEVQLRRNGGTDLAQLRRDNGRRQWLG